MPRSYAPQFRAMVVEQVRNGRQVAEVARSVEVPAGTAFRWIRQDRTGRALRSTAPGCRTPGACCHAHAHAPELVGRRRWCP